MASASCIDDFDQIGGIRSQIRLRQRGKVPHLEGMPCGYNNWAYGCPHHVLERVFFFFFFWKGVIKDIEGMVSVEL